MKTNGVFNLSTCLDCLEQQLDFADLTKISKRLNDSYQPFMPENKVWDLVFSVLPEVSKNILLPFQDKVLGHKIVNEIVLKYYPGEKAVKYHFVKDCLANDEEVTIFEMNIESSRVDIGRINGKSFAYEIKTELDTLDKLEKQVDDYSKAFEYVLVLAHEKHLTKVKKLVPSYCGIKKFNFVDGQCLFENERPPQLSPNISFETQIRNLSSKDLAFILKKIGVKLPTTRLKREQLIMECVNRENFNEYFKLALKNRFGEKWQYLRETFNNILPIDVQVFYATQANPKWIYYKLSSIV